MTFNARFKSDHDSGMIVVTFPDFGWGVTQGADEKEALEMAGDALCLILEDYIERELPIPEPKKLRGRDNRRIQLPLIPGAKVAFYREFKASGLTKADLARRLGTRGETVERLFNLRRRTPLRQLESAFAAIGKRIAVEVMDTAA